MGGPGGAEQGPLGLLHPRREGQGGRTLTFAALTRCLSSQTVVGVCAMLPCAAAMARGATHVLRPSQPGHQEEEQKLPPTRARRRGRRVALEFGVGVPGS